MISKKEEIKKQVIRDDPDLEKSGRILNRVIEWNHNGIKIEADQKVLSRSKRTHWNSMWCGKDGMKARWRVGADRNRPQAEHEWDIANDGDDRDRPQMVDDDDPDSQALTNGGITRYRAFVARISYLSQDRPDLKFSSMQVCGAMAKPTTRDLERVKRIGRYLVGKPRARCWFRWQQSGELEAYSDADWGSDKATRRSVSAGVIMRGGHCLTEWTKKQQVVALSSTESELYAAVKTASEGLGIQSVAKDLEITCRLNLHLDASATLSLVNRRGLGQAKDVDMQSLWIQEAPKSDRFATKKIGTNVSLAGMMTKPLTKLGMRRTRSSDVCQPTKLTQVLLRIEEFYGSSARARGRVLTDST